MVDLESVSTKVTRYKKILQNTEEYREAWDKEVKPKITQVLQQLIEETNLKAEVEIRDQLKHLESIIFNLGVSPSGIYEPIGEKFQKKLYKSHGMLAFQQLYNGKIIVMVSYPHIEEVANPHPAKTIEIIRPDELTDGLLVRYLESFFNEIIEWEDYDDNIPSTIGFKKKLEDNGLII